MYVAADSSGGGGLTLFLPLLLLAGVFYFMMIRPQQKRRRDAQQMQARLRPGTEVVTIGGLYGTVADTDDETVTLEIAQEVYVRYARAAVARVVSTPEEDSDAEEADSDNETVDAVDDASAEDGPTAPAGAEETSTEVPATVADGDAPPVGERGGNAKKK